jgi:hypothetical protein
VQVAEPSVRRTTGYRASGLRVCDNCGPDGSALARIERRCGRPFPFSDPDQEMYRPAALVKLVGKAEAAPYRR